MYGYDFYDEPSVIDDWPDSEEEHFYDPEDIDPSQTFPLL